jgi:hypothetical protein
MNALRIRKRLSAPIPELPELTPLLGKDLEIIVLDEESQVIPDPNAKGSFWIPKSAQELADERGIKPIQSIDQLRGDDFADAFEGFDEALAEWRRQPWRSEDPLKDFDLPGGKGT